MINRIEIGWPPPCRPRAINFQFPTPSSWDLELCDGLFKDPGFHKTLLLNFGGFMDMDYECLRRLINTFYLDIRNPNRIAPEDMEAIVFYFALGGTGEPVIPRAWPLRPIV